MGTRFNAEEVFLMAEKKETNAAEFYRRAAELKPEDSDFLLELSEMEKRHRKTFAGMRSELGESGYEDEISPDSYVEAVMYLDAQAESAAGEGNPAAAQSLTGEESIRELLEIGIDLEEKSISFYTGIKEMVSEKLGNEKIDGIIAEEKRHLVELTEKLKKTL